jgi:hypothetical protein
VNVNRVPVPSWEERLERLRRLAAAEAPHTADYIHALLQHNGEETPDFEEILAAFLAFEPKDSPAHAVGVRAWTEGPYKNEPSHRELHVRLILHSYPDGKHDDPSGGYQLMMATERRLQAMIPPSWELKTSIATEKEWIEIESRDGFSGDRFTISLGKP